MNTPLPKTDLSGAFGKSPRAAAISLPARRKSPQTDETAPQTPVHAVPDPKDADDRPKDVSAAKAPQKAKTAAKKPARKPAPQPQPDSKKVVLALWTPESIRDRMRKVREETGDSYLHQVLAAINATAGELPELVKAAQAPKAVEGSLFAGLTDTAEAEYHVQVTIRGVLASDLEVIDSLAKSSGARSRAILINAALDKVLPA